MNDNMIKEGLWRVMMPFFEDGVETRLRHVTFVN